MSEVMDELDAAAGFDGGESAQPDGTQDGSLEVGAESPAAPEARAEPEGPAAEPSAAAAAPTWTDSPEFRNAVAEEAALVAQAQVQQAFQQYAGQQYDEGQGAQPDFDVNEFLSPLNDDFGGNLVQVIQGVVQQAQAPFLQAQQAQQAQEADARLNDVIADTISRNGELVGDSVTDRIRDQARDILNQLASRYGFNDRTAERAIEQAYQAERAYQEAVGRAYHERQMNELRGLAGAPTQPATSAHGAPVHGDAESELDIAARWGQ